MFDHAVDTVGTAMAGVLVTQEVALAQHVALMVDQPMIPRLRGSKIKQMNAKKKIQTQAFGACWTPKPFFWSISYCTIYSAVPSFCGLGILVVIATTMSR